MRPRAPSPGAALATCLLTLGSGCQSAIVDGTDRSVYRLIEDRQKSALGATADPGIGAESGELVRPPEMYSHDPHPTTPEIPQSFRKAPDRAPDAPSIRSDAVSSMTESIFSEEEQATLVPSGLRDILTYSMRHSREYQDAKEALYLAALDLSLERHLWTPQFVASIQAEFVDLGQVTDFDRAMTAVSNAAVTQRLPYGGDVSARIVNTLMRDLKEHATSGETGNVILEANIPLLRGAGRVARESLYSAERELVYAVRNFERFRRSFLVDVAVGYFELQQLKMEVANTFVAYNNRRIDWEKADFRNRLGQSTDVFEAARVQSIFRGAAASLVGSKARYAAVLDRFKILIGMPVEDLLDVMEQDVDADAAELDQLLPEVAIGTAVDVAVKYRLDILNGADRVDDARRGVLIAKNRILPDLDASGSVTLDTDETRFNSVSYNTERATWRGLVELRMDDRKTERNAYRASLINLRKAERDYERAVDSVRADVRAAIRQITRQELVREIQTMNVTENELRVEAARAQYNLGKTSNREVVEAEDALLTARNNLADAVAGYRNAILVFRRDTETLRVTEDGRWESPP